MVVFSSLYVPSAAASLSCELLTHELDLTKPLQPVFTASEELVRWNSRNLEGPACNSSQ